MFLSLKKITEFTWSMREHGAQSTTYNGGPLLVGSLPSPPTEPYLAPYRPTADFSALYAYF